MSKAPQILSNLTIHKLSNPILLLNSIYTYIYIKDDDDGSSWT